MATKRSLRLTDRFRVVADDGSTYDVLEHTEFLTVQPLSGPSSTVAGLRRLTNGRHPVNLNDDGTYDVFTGEMAPVRCRRP